MDGIANQIFQLSKILRLAKQTWMQQRPTVPAGSVGTLALIKEMGQQATGCHAKEVAARAGLDPSTVSRTVATMVSLGLVERRADPYDGRATMLALTDAGETLLAEAQGWFDAVLRRTLDGWRPEEIDCVVRFLTALEAEFIERPGADRAGDQAWQAATQAGKPWRATTPEVPPRPAARADQTWRPAPPDAGAPLTDDRASTAPLS